MSTSTPQQIIFPSPAEPFKPLERLRTSSSGDWVLYVLVTFCGLLVLGLLGGIFVQMLLDSREAMHTLGWGFLTTDNWDPVTGQFGALSSIYGTLMSTAIAMIIAVPVSLVIALFLTEMAPPWLSTLVAGAIDLLAAIPSIIYGMWGMFVFAPFMADHVEPWIKHTWLGHTWLFSGPPLGLGMLTAGIILGLMVLPFITAVTRDIFRMSPPVLRESAYGMGSTTWEVTRNVTIPYGLRGIMGASFLGLGRALGETMAVTFVIGNDHTLHGSLFAGGNTISSTLANEFAEAQGSLYSSALVELGLVLLVITVIAQIVAQIWLKWATAGSAGGR